MRFIAREEPPSRSGNPVLRVYPLRSGIVAEDVSVYVGRVKLDASRGEGGEMLCEAGRAEAPVAQYQDDENTGSTGGRGGGGGGGGVAGPVVVMVGTVADVGVEYVRGRENGIAAGEELRACPFAPVEPCESSADAGADATSPFSARSISSRQTATLRCACKRGIVGHVPTRSALAPTTKTMSSSGMFFRSSGWFPERVSCLCGRKSRFPPGVKVPHPPSRT